jgi:hypothetical protein
MDGGVLFGKNVTIKIEANEEQAKFYICPRLSSDAN